jgi:hypothetical protein
MISLGLSHAEASDRPQPPVEVTRALGEAAAWCTLHPLGTDNLRSSLLDPHSSLTVPTLNELGIDAFVKAKRESYKQAVESIQRKRSEWLRKAKSRPFEPTETQSLGRLLLYEAMETVSDGAAEASSHSFYDVEDAPPWDTWFWYKDGTIFCWVPDALVSDAQAGIDANPVDCIHWANWSALGSLINR